MNPVRTCVGCRQRSNQTELVRLVQRSGEVFPDPSKSQSGRGAWLHANEKCLTKALESGSFARSFKCRIIRVEQVQRYIEQAEMMLASNE